MDPLHRGWGVVAPAVFVLIALAATPAVAQKTDVITIANGDRITGEIKGLERGRVEFSTDDMGTIYLEWDKVVSLVSTNLFEVGTAGGRRMLGRLETAPPRSITVTNMLGTVNLPMPEVTEIRPMGGSFWQKLDGSLDIGFSYTRSSGIAQLNLNSTTRFRRPSFEMSLDGSGTVTWTEDEAGGEEERDDRGTVQASYLRFRRERAFVGGTASFESNDSLGLELRSQAAVFAGLRWLNTNRAQLYTAGGIAVNDERNVDAESTQNVEGLLNFGFSYYTYDRPKTNIDFTFTYYPSFSNFGRQRLQLDSSFKREILKDFFVSVNVFDTFDSQPASADSRRNDVGLVFSIGWTY